MTDATTPDSGVLSFDAAVARLEGEQTQPEAQIEEAAPEEAAEPEEADDEIEADPAAEGEDEEPAEDDEPDPELPAIDAPKSWDAEAKKRFADLPRDLQETIAAREADRDRAVSQANQQANEVKQQAQKAMEGFGALKSQIDQTLEVALPTFKSRWEGIDWVQWTRDDPMAALEGKAMFEQEQAQLNELQAARARAEAAEYQQHVTTEATKLADLAPDLVDPEKGADRKREVGTFLVQQGYTAEQLKWIGASDLAIAYDAMRYRALQDKARAELTKPKPAKPAPPAVKPAAAQPRTSQQRSVEQIRARLNKTGSIDDAVALLEARRK